MTILDDHKFVAKPPAMPAGGAIRAQRLLGGVPALGLLGLFAPSFAQAACLPSNQSIGTSLIGPLLGDGGNISILPGGSVTGGANGVDLIACGASRLDNAGSLSGTQGIVLGTASAGTITNSGSISAGSAGIASGGTIGVLSNSGAISALGRGAASGVTNSGTIATLTNGGTIRAGGYGVQNSGGLGSVTNTGSIVGGIAGLRNNGGTIGPLANTGVLSGGAFGIRATGGAIASVTNGGSITGTRIAIGNDGGAIGAIVNSGTINGYNAIYSTGAGASIGAITNTGTIRGNIVVQNQDVTIAGGSGANFGTLTSGAVTVSDGNLRLTGNQLLDQNVTVRGGAGVVTAQGVLQLATRHTITGDFALSGGTLDLLASGASAGQYGGLSVTGAVTLAGGFALDLTDGYLLATGDTFDAIDGYTGISGNIGSFALNGIACSSVTASQWMCAGSGSNALIAAVTNGGELDIVVQSVPEPASIGLFAAALGLLAWFVPGRRTAPGRISRRRRPRS